MNANHQQLTIQILIWQSNIDHQQSMIKCDKIWTVNYQMLIFIRWWTWTTTSWQSKSWWAPIVGKFLTGQSPTDHKLLMIKCATNLNCQPPNIDVHALMNTNHQQLTVQILIVHYCQSTFESLPSTVELHLVKKLNIILKDAKQFLKILNIKNITDEIWTYAAAKESKMGGNFTFRSPKKSIFFKLLPLLTVKFIFINLDSKYCAQNK